MNQDEIREMFSHVDHTCLKVDATWEDIRRLCDEGMRYQVATVCLPPAYVRQARAYVGDRLAISTVIGFPNGYSTLTAKISEAAGAIADGADELDMVIHVGRVKEKNYDAVEGEIRAVKAVCGKKILKVIIETCLLTQNEKEEMCRVVAAAGADYIKTSTGFSAQGATPADVVLLTECSPKGLKVKASGGIATVADAWHLLIAGADRIGTSRLVAAIEEMKTPKKADEGR